MTPTSCAPAWREPTERLWNIVGSVKFSEADLAEIKRALADGALLDAIAPFGESILCRAVARTGDPRAVQLLLDAGAPLFDAQGRCEALKVSQRLIFDEGGEMARYVQERVGLELALRERAELSQSAPPGPLGARRGPRV